MFEDIDPSAVYSSSTTMHSVEKNAPQRKSWKECIRHFTWAWHTVIMGTGAVSTLAHAFPYGEGSYGLKVVTLFFFFLNLVLFILISGVTIARYWMFPEVWPVMLRHPAQSLFIGAFPMGVTTLITVALVANQEWNFGGNGFLYTLWSFWWLDSIISYIIVFGMIYVMMIRQDHSLPTMAAVWLLPIVTLVVASSTGGVLAQALRSHSATLAMLTTAFSFTMVFVGLSLALMMITIYLMRLVIHGPPDANLILSAFVVLGPLGQGGYSLLINGQVIGDLLPLQLGDSFPAPALIGQMVYSACFCGAYILWSMGVSWILIAVCSIYNVVRKEKGIPFSMAYWGLIFPNGVFAMLSVELAKVLDSPFFRVFGAIWSIIVLLLWIVVFARTVPAVIDRSIFNAPYLSSAPAKSLLPIAADSDKYSLSDLPAGTRTPLSDTRTKCH